jgi:ABC-type bacteriocin/lantibiotic exporter with double-glycine peptidase domain
MKATVMSWIHDPTKFKRINGWLVVFWIVMIPISVVLGWVSSVEYVSALSIYALVTGHLSTWQAARVEERQEEDDSKQIALESQQTIEEIKQTQLEKQQLDDAE